MESSYSFSLLLAQGLCSLHVLPLSGLPSRGLLLVRLSLTSFGHVYPGSRSGRTHTPAHERSSPCPSRTDLSTRCRPFPAAACSRASRVRGGGATQAFANKWRQTRMAAQPPLRSVGGHQGSLSATACLRAEPGRGLSRLHLIFFLLKDRRWFFWGVEGWSACIGTPAEE